MRISGDVHRARVELRRHHFRDPRTRRESGQVLRDVGPGLAGITRHADHTVVGAGVVDAGGVRRFGEGHNRRPRRDAVIGRNADFAAAFAHDFDFRAVGVRCEIGADDRPRIAAIVRTEHLVRGHDQRGGIVRREHHRRVPIPAVRQRAFFRARPHGFKARADVGGFTRQRVLALDVAVLRLRVHVARIVLVDEDHEAVAALHLIPVTVQDALGETRLAGAAPVVVVLQTAAHTERQRVVHTHVIEERERQVVVLVPRLAHVVRHGDAAVVADQNVIRIRRIDPNRMHVVMCGQRGVRRHRAATINRHLQADAAVVHAVRVVRINVELAEVHRTRVVVAHLTERCAAVV